MDINYELDVSENLIELFRNKEYEKYIFMIMQSSTKIFNGTYEHIQMQSHGECDFIDIKTGEKFDVKLPFTSQQMKLLTAGKEHDPLIVKWLKELKNESELYVKSGQSYIKKDLSTNKLYNIIKSMIQRDKADENIIFFIPFPITISSENSIYLQFANDFLTEINYELVNEVDLLGRSIYVIYPSAKKSQFVIRDLQLDNYEYLECHYLDQYFSYEIVEKLH